MIIFSFTNKFSHRIVVFVKNKMLTCQTYFLLGTITKENS